MNQEKNKKTLLNFVVFIHTIIFIVGFLGLFLIFINPFQQYFMIFFLVVVGIEIIFYSNCPLTILEDKLRVDLNLEKDANTFINRIFKKHFNFAVSEKLVTVVLAGYFIFSLYLFFKI